MLCPDTSQGEKMARRGDTTREWLTVLDALEVRLRSGTVKAGDLLPSARALASSLKVRRSSVWEALSVLEVLSLISIPSRSNFGPAGIIVASPSGGMGALMRLQVAAQGFRLKDIVTTRLLLEGAVAKDLAERHDSVDLTALTGLIEAMDDPTLGPTEYVALNGKFHLALAEVSGNKIVSAVMVGLRNSIETVTLEGTDTVANWATIAGRLQDEHRELLRTIVTGDGALAAEQMRKHISDYYTETHVISELP